MYISNKFEKLFFIFIMFIFYTTSFVFSQSIRTGIYSTVQFPTGETANYFLNSFGGGINAEFGFSKHFGESIRIQYSTVMPKENKILSSYQFSELFGIWYYIPLGKTGFAIQPSLEFGIVYQGAITNQGYGKLSQSSYADFIFQLCPSFRYRNEHFIKNHIEIELAPVWTLIPEKSVMMSYVGARLGVMYIFDIKK